MLIAGWEFLLVAIALGFYVLYAVVYFIAYLLNHPWRKLPSKGVIYGAKERYETAGSNARHNLKLVRP